MPKPIVYRQATIVPKERRQVPGILNVALATARQNALFNALPKIAELKNCRIEIRESIIGDHTVIVTVVIRASPSPAQPSKRQMWENLKKVISKKELLFPR